MYFIPTASAEHVAKILEKNGENVLYAGMNKDGKRRFPDGEIYVRVDGVEKLAGERVVVLHSGQPLANEGLVELYSILEVLGNPVASEHVRDKEYRYRKVKAPASVEVFFLYYPYGMQDKVFETGECNMAESVIKVLSSHYNVKKVYALDPHFEGASWVKNYPLEVVHARDAIRGALAADKAGDAITVAPDMGAQARLDAPGFTKKRLNSFDVELSGEHDVKGRTVVVWDDLIETGGTMAKACSKIAESGAKKVYAAATHGVLESGIKRIGASCAKLYLTNSIDTPYANVDVSGVVLGAVKQGRQ